MSYSLNSTHDPKARSWVTSANEETSEFPIQNLPFGVFQTKGKSDGFRIGVAIGDSIVDMPKALASGALEGLSNDAKLALGASSLNAFMALGKQNWSQVRASLFAALSEDSGAQNVLSDCLVTLSDAEYAVPAQIGDYTDFYTSIHHATNVGKLFRPDNPLLPNYQWIPIGYHGRSSSIEVSGHSFHRPKGQLKPPTADTPTLEPCKRLDYELEVGIYIGTGNELGSAIELDNAEDHVFGLCLFNDWSARDIQAWEYQPLGPFLSKSFASTLSPWIVSMEALAPFRQAWQRDVADPQPLAYLDSDSMRESGAVDMKLEILIQTTAMREQGVAAESVAKSNFNHSYWNIAQMVAHHSVNGCNLRPGDLFGSGTLSGPSADSVGALLEATQGGKNPITLSNGEQRTFLEDGDTVVLRGYCDNSNARRIGFGEAVASILPAI